MSDDHEVDLHIQSYPADGDKSVTRPVEFGPSNKSFALLIEVNPETEELTVTIGNGPANTLIPQIIPDVLANVANVIEQVGDNPEFWEQINSEG